MVGSTFGEPSPRLCPWEVVTAGRKEGVCVWGGAVLARQS